ncbi:glutamyl-tRNA reductase [Paenibacillus sp. alder61]|uniref:Glutamyl-tRNA reductase n=1 Tax=Paenibacillus faecis TaxID=862114 RepID=A0A5D0CMD5_9BACL|nr:MULTISPECIES: glutamyl-tRNA reductase [Paenibacillus]MCA1295829.1 glutamyl-tRNA reductase [Paenibacillus sp. alder61]TYA11028.1 glutamyl-tRNA reductase [Paenibacillus faecis]
MHIVVVGLNYRTAPVEVRERFAFADKDMPQALQELKRTKSVLEGVIIATCNRTEIYVVVDRLHMCGYFIRSFMEKWFGIPREEFTKHLYMYEDEQAIRHLFRVACGLDSMVLGETQILGQVRSAFLLSQREKGTGKWFNMLFKQAVTLSKRAHSETSIGESAVSVSYAAVELGKRIFGSFTGKRVLILGAGKMSELTAKHLSGAGAEEVIVANRTFGRAQELAAKFNGTPCSMQEAMNRLTEVDILISSTGAEGYVITQSQVAKSMQQRPERPLFMIDIAVPRDIDPSIGELDHVFLYDIDDLEGIVESNLEMRRGEAVKIEEMIEAEIEAFGNWLQTLGVKPVIRALQEKSSAIHETTLESMFNKLPELDERQRKVIRRLTKSIVNQMMHDPINRIKELAGEEKGAEALDWFTQIFALEEHIKMLDESSLESGASKEVMKLSEDEAAPAAPPLSLVQASV